MSKPLTTLGEAIMAKGGTGEGELDWRSQLRANGIERRTGQPMDALGRPDRGYVEQPEERVAPLTPRPAPTTTQLPPLPFRSATPEQIAPFMRRRTETPTLTAPTALIRFERYRDNPEPEQPLKDEKEEPMQQQYEPEPANVATQPASPATEGSDMPRKRKKRVQAPDAATRDEMALRILRAELDGRRKGEVKAIMAETNVSESGVSRWVQLYKAKHPRWRQKVAAMQTASEGKAPPNPGGSTIPLETRERLALSVLRQEATGTILAEQHGVSSSAIYQWTMKYKATHPNWEKEVAAGRDKTLVSAPMSRPAVSGPVSIPASINSGSLPPLPVITVAGVPNTAFEITGLAEWCQAMIQLGVKAELKRRLGDD